MNSISIAGKRILFFGLETMGYEKKILNKMIELGAKVDYNNERSVSSQFGKAIVKIAPDVLRRKTEIYYREILKKRRKNHYDIIFMIKCDVPTRNILQELKEQFPDSELRLYMWDSMKNIPNIEEKIDLFDRVLSFDRLDCEKHREFGFRPLFYIDQFSRKSAKEIIYDISFCGTIHTDRYKILDKISKQCEEKRLNFYGYYYMQSKAAYYYLKITDKRFRHVPINSIHFQTIDSYEVNEIFSSSKAILDIQHPDQTGLTMRTIESIGACKKLITTNSDVINYDFYDKNNICIIDRDNPIISDEFILSKYYNIDRDISKKYSLEQWILDVLTM